MANAFTIKSIFEAVDRLTGPVKTMRGNMTKFSKGVKGEFSGIAQGAGKLKGLLVGAVAAITTGAIVTVGKSFSNAGAEAEKYLAVLKTMLGSQEAANARFEEMSKFAADTPFELSEVVQLGNQLQALGKYSTENMTILGDLAAAAGKPIDQVTRAYAKLASGQKGVAVDMFRDLLITTKDWTEATGKGVSKSGQMLATTEQMLAALPKILSAKKFNGMMAEQSKTFGGITSNFMDSISRLKMAVGGALNESLKKIIPTFQSLIESITKWVVANKELITQKIDKIFNTIGKAAQFIGKAWKSGLIPAILAGIAVFKTFKIVMAAATAVQWAINAAMTANPIGLIIVGVAALIAGIVLLIVHWKKVTAFVKEFAGVFIGYLSLFAPQLAQLIAFIVLLKENWQGITAAFREGGIIEGLKAIGATILQSLLRPIRDFLRLLSKIPGVGKLIAPAMNFVNGLDTQLGAAANKYKTPVSPQAAAIESRSMTESRSTVDLNVSTAPGASIAARQSGSAPGFTLNLGRPSPLGAR